MTACGGKAIVDDPATGGQSSSSSSSSSTPINPTTTTTTSTSTTTKPPPPPPPGCIGCADYLSSEANIDELCPESMALLEALGTCVCGENDDGVCIKECPESCGLGGPEDSQLCSSCIESECEQQLIACFNDV